MRLPFREAKCCPSFSTLPEGPDLLARYILLGISLSAFATVSFEVNAGLFSFAAVSVVTSSELDDSVSTLRTISSISSPEMIDGCSVGFLVVFRLIAEVMFVAVAGGVISVTAVTTFGKINEITCIVCSAIATRNRLAGLIFFCREGLSIS